MSEGNSGILLTRLIRWLILAAMPSTAFVVLLSVQPPLSITDFSVGAFEPVLLSLGRWAGLAMAGWLVASQILYTAGSSLKPHG
jgi:hypothetical protein